MSSQYSCHYCGERFSSKDKYRAHTCAYREDRRSSSLARESQSLAVSSRSAKKPSMHDMATYIQQVKEYYEQYINTQRSDYESEIHNLTGMVATLKRNLEGQRDDMQERLNRSARDLKSQNETLVADNRILLERLRNITVDTSMNADMKAQYTTEISKLNVEVANLRQDIQTLKTTHVTEANQARLAKDKEFSQIEHAHRMEIEQLQLEFQPKIELLEQQVVAQRETYEKRFKEEVTTIKSNYSTSLSEHVEKHNATVKDLETRLAKQERTHRDTVEDISKRHRLLKEQLEDKTALVAELKDRVQTVTAESKTKMESAVAEHVRTTKQQTEHITTLDTQCKELKEQLASQAKRVTELQEECAHTKQHAQEELQVLRERCQTIHAQYNTKETAFAKREELIRAECAETVYAMEKRLHERDNDYAEAEAVKEKVEEQTITILQSRKHIESLKVRIRDLTNKATTAEETKHTAVVQLATNKRKLKEYEEMGGKLERKVASVTMKLQLTTQHKEDIERQCKELQTELRQMETKLNQLKIMSSHAQSTLPPLQRERDLLKESADRLTDENEALRKTVVQQSTEMDRLHHAKNLLTKTTNGRVSEVKKQLKSANEQVTTLTEQLSAVQQQHDTLDASIATYQNEKQVLQKRFMDVSSRAAALETQVEAMKDLESTWTAKYDELAGKHATLVEHLKSLDAEKHTMSTQTCSLTKANDTLVEQIKILEHKANALSNDMRVQAQEHKKELNDLNTVLDKVSAEYATVQEQHAKLLKESKEAHERYLKNLSQVKAAHADTTKENMNLKQTNTELTTTNTELTKELANSERDRNHRAHTEQEYAMVHEQYAHTIDKLRKRVTMQKQIIEKHDIQEKTMKTMATELRKQCKTLGMQLKMAEETSKGSTQTGIELKETFKAWERDLKKGIDERDATIATLKANKESMQQHYNEVVQHIKTVEANHAQTELQYKQELERLQQKHERTLQEVREECAKKYTNAASTKQDQRVHMLEVQLQDMHNAHQEQLKRNKEFMQAHSNEVSQHIKTMQKAHVQAETKYKQEIKALKKTNEEALQQVKEEYATKYNDTNTKQQDQRVQSLETQLQDMRKTHQEQLKRLEDSHKAHLQKRRAEHNEQLTVQKTQYTNSVATFKRAMHAKETEFNTALAALEKQSKQIQKELATTQTTLKETVAELTDLKRDHKQSTSLEKELDLRTSKFGSFTDKMVRDFNAQKQQLQTDLETVRRDLSSKNAELDALRNDNANIHKGFIQSIQELTQNHAKQLETLTHTHSQEMQSLRDNSKNDA